MVEERMEVVEVMSGWCGQEERRTERDCQLSHSYPAAAVTTECCRGGSPCDCV